MGGERCEYAHLSRSRRWLKPGPQSLSPRGETQHARAPVRPVHAAVDQAQGLEFFRKLAHAGAVNTHSGGDAVLIDAGLARHAAEVGQNGKLSCFQALRGNQFPRSRRCKSGRSDAPRPTERVAPAERYSRQTASSLTSVAPIPQI